MTKRSGTEQRAASPGDPTRNELVSLLLAEEVLQFGEFTLKSGRHSPYFFNMGKLTRGPTLARLAAAYRARLESAQLEPDVLFGPAYKGIPLAVAVALDWSAHGRDVGIAYNRKEAKQHGEGGTLVGAKLAGRSVLLLDDVLTAGTAIREAVTLVRGAGGTVAGVVIAMDRMERVSADDPRSAVAALAEELAAPVLSLLTIADLRRFVEANAGQLDANTDADHGNLVERLVSYQSANCVALDGA